MAIQAIDNYLIITVTSLHRHKPAVINNDSEIIVNKQSVQNSTVHFIKSFIINCACDWTSRRKKELEYLRMYSLKD